MEGRNAKFLGVSVELTGFDRFELNGTGMGETYLQVLDEVLPAGMVDALLEAWPVRGDEAVLADPTLGPVARNIILLWYRGTWSALPDDWRAAHGAAAADKDRVVSGAAYRAGLQWAAAGGHPAGADAQGYASWAAPPAAGPAKGPT